jgi:hypothetical protein
MASERKVKDMKRMFTTVALAATMLLGTTATALAFEPPADPANKFSAGACDDVVSIVDGHPGAEGQWAAILSGGPERTVAAWNATEDEFSNSAGRSQVVVGCIPVP